MVAAQVIINLTLHTPILVAIVMTQVQVPVAIVMTQVQVPVIIMGIP
jgi:hypothetical protein